MIIMNEKTKKRVIISVIIVEVLIVVLAFYGRAKRYEDSTIISTTGIIVDKEYRRGTIITHHRYQFKVRFVDKIDGKEQESTVWLDVTPTDYDNYEIGDEYECTSKKREWS